LEEVKKEMTEKMKTHKFTSTLKATPAQVYYAFTNATALRGWLANDVVANARKDGRIYLWWDSGYYTAGKFISLEKDQKVMFSWHGQGEPAPTKVAVALKKKGSETEVIIQHGGIGPGKAWKEASREIVKGWDRGLENLKAVLETGYDQRLYNRPMMGVTISQLVTEEVAAKQGLPVDYGIQISGVVKGMGAEAAEMQKDDIIVNVDGIETKNFQDLNAALDAHKAGDTVDFVVYRGEEKVDLEMTLSGRPKPEVPDSAQGLSESIASIYGKMNVELEGILDGVTEEDASYKPNAEEWNVREVMAHLISSERDNCTWIASLAQGEEIPAYYSNLPARLKAVVATYPTVSQLVDEMKHAQAEVVALLAELPTEFVERKIGYIRMGSGLLEGFSYHLKDHLNKIQELVEAARSLT
jgi:uncharacterized protein YndB with AHSA1/START domain